MQDGEGMVTTDVSSKQKKKGPNPVDIHVGSRVRLRRMLVGLSQEKLGDSMGLTFQQIQKYEKGVNRIGASRLFKLSQVLDVPVQFFFDGMPAVEDGSMPELGDGDSESYLYEFLNTRDGLELNRAFMKVSNPEVRRAIIDLVRTLGRGKGRSKS
ncbi:MAG: helix-turn-helix domain-containing protein [Hyphomicrobiaceae bacterium]|nr:helix-turn-helix domain-containing protein [Hyphomicrobiaceae bacterium]